MADQKYDNTATAASEQAMALMEQSEQLSDGDISRMLADKAVVADARDLWNVKRAIDTHESPAPDAGSEWSRFKAHYLSPARKPLRPTLILYPLLAAAVLLVLFLIPWHRLLNPPVSPEVAMQTAVKTRQVVITSDNGEEVILGDQPVSAIGKGVAQQGQGAIIYVGTPKGRAAVHTITIPPGKTFKVVLADGSEVWLNAGSQLTYPTVFGSTRDVELQGEAYFKVRHDATRPFTVRAGNILTRVMGTEFNVRCIKDKPVHVTLISGRVSVSQKGHEAYVMRPGEDAVPASDGTFAVRSTDTSTFTYWKDGYFYFDDKPLQEVMDEIAPWYNVKVVFRNSAARRYRMHVFFDRHRLDEAIRQINMMEKVSVEKKGDTLFVE